MARGPRTTPGPKRQPGPARPFEERKRIQDEAKGDFFEDVVFPGTEALGEALAAGYEAIREMEVDQDNVVDEDGKKVQIGGTLRTRLRQMRVFLYKIDTLNHAIQTDTQRFFEPELAQGRGEYYDYSLPRKQ